MAKLIVRGGKIIKDYSAEVIHCRHCGLVLSRFDLPAPEGPYMKGMHCWSHMRIGVLCPPIIVNERTVQTSAEPSEYVREIFDAAINAVRLESNAHD